MKKVVLMLAALAVVFGVSVSLNTDSASAMPPFKAGFDKMYMTEGSAMFKAMEGKSNCNVCHVGPTDRKKRNALGMALDKHLSKEDATKPDVIAEAMKKIASEKSGGADSPTFGDLIKEGKLPITKDAT